MHRDNWAIVLAKTVQYRQRPQQIGSFADLEKIGKLSIADRITTNNGTVYDTLIINGHAPIEKIGPLVSQAPAEIRRLCMVENAELSLEGFAELSMFGVIAFLALPCSNDDLDAALERARSGETYLSEILSVRLLRRGGYAGGEHDWPSLSAREREVLTLMLQGQSTKVIARNLDVSVRTVEAHRLSIRKKTGGSSYAQLALLL